MSMFRAKKLDLGCFVNVRTLRDHTKRKVFEQNETERCANSSLALNGWTRRSGNDDDDTDTSMAAVQSIPLGHIRHPSRRIVLTKPLQASPPIHHPQHHPPSSSPRRSPAAADADALLHPPDPDPKPMHHGRPGSRCAERLQADESKPPRRATNDPGSNKLQFNFRMEAIAGNLPGVKRASW